MYDITRVERACSALNSPEKCITLALLDNPNGSPLHVDVVRDEYNALHDRPSRHPEHKSSTDIRRWVEHSLIPCDLAEETGQVSFFRLSKFGREIGIPLAGHLMRITYDYLLESGYDIEDLIGVNKPTRAQDPLSIRTPMRRLAFARALLTTPSLPVQQIRLEEDILKLGAEYVGGFDLTLRALDRVGAVVYNSGRREAIAQMEEEGKDGRKEFVRYRISDTIPLVNIDLLDINAKELTQDICLYFEINPDEDLLVSKITDRLIENFEKYRHYGKTPESKETLLAKLRNHLPTMANHKLLSKSKYHGLYQSEIDLTDFGRAVLGDIITTLDMTASGDRKFLQSGREEIECIMASKTKVLEFLGRRKR